MEKQTEAAGSRDWHVTAWRYPPQSLFDLTGRVAVVTGAASGLGRAIALGLDAYGARVVLADRDAEGAVAVADVLSNPPSSWRPMSPTSRRSWPWCRRR